MSTEKKYRLTHDFEHLSRELFNELSRENGFTVERALEGDVVVLTVEKNHPVLSIQHLLNTGSLSAKIWKIA